MRQLVDDGDADLILQLRRVREVGLERQAEERDLVWQRHVVRAPLGGRHALVQAVEPAVGARAAELGLLSGGGVLDDHGHVLEQHGELRRQAVERAFDEDLEGLVAAGWRRQPASGMLPGELTASSQGHEQSMARLVVARPHQRPDRTYAQAVSSSQPATPAGIGPEPESMVVPLQGGERLHYLHWPAAHATPERFLLIHGLTRTAWTWLPIGRRLAAAGHAVIAPDLRGHGASDAPLQGYELESLALDALTVAAGAGWGEVVEGPPVVVAGHGLGAMVAAETARLQPASVAAVALVDGGWEEMVEATRLLPDQLVEAMAEPPEVLASMATYLADRRDFDPASWDLDQERAARAQVSERHAGHVGPVTKGSVVRRCVAAMYGYDPLEALTQVRCPLTVLVAGATTADDEDERERRLAIDDAQAARAAAGLAPMVVHVFEGAGHDLMRYRPLELTRELEVLAAR